MYSYSHGGAIMRGTYPEEFIAMEDTPELLMFSENISEPVSACHACEIKRGQFDKQINTKYACV